MNNFDKSSKMNTRKEGTLWYWGIMGYIALACITPYYAIRIAFAKKYRAGLRQRFTLYTQEEKKQLRNGLYIWIHTVSLGELQASRPLLRRLKQEFKDVKTLVTTVTESGQTMARTLPEVDAAYYLPLDLFPLCRRMLSMVRPDKVIIMETEIWPNFIRAVSAFNVPLILLNARLSEHSFRNYYRARFLFKPVLRCFASILAQSDIDAKRFIQIGAPYERVEAIGNIKFDAVEIQQELNEAQIWRSIFCIDKHEIVLLGGSTFPGEEMTLAQVYSSLRNENIPVRLLLAPRHIERADIIQKELRSSGYHCILRSQLKGNHSELDHSKIILLDTIGELKNVYSIADIVFVGKSLHAKGGQNPIEPAVWGKAIIFGPNMQNFLDVAALLTENEGAMKISDENELFDVCKTLYLKPELRETLGRNAQQLVIKNQGTLDKIFSVLKMFLNCSQ